MRDPKIEALAERFYDADLPYHNFSHALDATLSGLEVVKRCRKAGIPVKEKVVYYALLFHDAGFVEDHVKKGFNSKEAYSASIARNCLTSSGVSEPIIAEVEIAILGTQKQARPSTTETKAVRAADLAQLAADYPTFKKNAISLRAESERFSGQKITWVEWREKVREELEYYLAQNLYLTEDPYSDPESHEFHVRARSNLKKLLEDEEPKT